jgi:hypothetical protein
LFWLLVSEISVHHCVVEQSNSTKWWQGSRQKKCILRFFPFFPFSLSCSPSNGWCCPHSAFLPYLFLSGNALTDSPQQCFTKLLGTSQSRQADNQNQPSQFSNCKSFCLLKIKFKIVQVISLVIPSRM